MKDEEVVGGDALFLLVSILSNPLTMIVEGHYNAVEFGNCGQDIVGKLHLPSDAFARRQHGGDGIDINHHPTVGVGIVGDVERCGK